MADSVRTCVLAPSFASLASYATFLAHGTYGIAIVLVVLAPIMGQLFSVEMLPRDANGIYSGGSSLYDLSFHAAIASSFAYGENFPPVYPLLPPEPLLYPPLPDFTLQC